MKNRKGWLVLALAAIIAVAPALAEARGGGGKSVGTRGARTTQSAPATPTAPAARPVERTATPAPQQAAPSPNRPAQAAPATRPNAPTPAPQRSFMGGLMAGLIGAGLVGLLLGSGLGFEGLSGFLGMVLQLALIGGVIYLVMMWWRRRQAGNGNRYAYAGSTASGPAGGRDIEPTLHERTTEATGRTIDMAPPDAAPIPAEPVRQDDLGITKDDYEVFERRLIEIQTAWSQGDVGALRSMMTEEMLGYFTEELTANAAKGIENRVEDVQLQQGDLAEAWREDDREYATVAMRWRARDYALHSTDGSLVEGDRDQPSEATEVWTFVRPSGGVWVLSAIQQVR
ncbi:MAG: hypothetical protein FJX65_11130 [Alphaproteobacteria bacterium]|nr:hypothetical protein [Alphaproteobacteria bacterium]